VPTGDVDEVEARQLLGKYGAENISSFDERVDRMAA